MEEKGNILQECNELTLTLIEKLETMSDLIIDESRDDGFEYISEKLNRRGELLQALTSEMCEEEKELYSQFHHNNEKLSNLISNEKMRLNRVSSKLGKNRVAHMQYFKNK